MPSTAHLGAPGQSRQTSGYASSLHVALTPDMTICSHGQVQGDTRGPEFYLSDNYLQQILQSAGTLEQRVPQDPLQQQNYSVICAMQHCSKWPRPSTGQVEHCVTRARKPALYRVFVIKAMPSDGHRAGKHSSATSQQYSEGPRLTNSLLCKLCKLIMESMSSIRFLVFFKIQKFKNYLKETQ